MKIIKPSATIEAFTPNLNEVIEAAGRTCWKSEDKIEPGSAGPFIQRVKGFKHESVLEHGAITVRFICDRGVSHELVRHRLCSFSQESTRYCNYGKSGELTFIEPCFWQPNDELYAHWGDLCRESELVYMSMLALGAKPQEARSILPNSLKTEIVVTTNPRDWRHIFSLRCDRAAHPQMREIMIPLWEEFSRRWPELFADVEFTK